MTKKYHSSRLPGDHVRWECNPDIFDFETTDQVELINEVLGQATARDALLFGIQCDAPGQNVYVRGARGTGRTKMVELLLEELQPQTDKKRDYCYVHNFTRAQNPRLITLMPGEAPKFKKAITELAQFAEEGLQKALESEPYQSQFQKLRESVEESVGQISGPLEKELQANGLELVSMQNGPITQTAIFPVVDGQPVQPNQLRTLIAEGKIEASVLEKYEELFPKFQKQLEETTKKVGEAFRAGNLELEEMREKAVRELLANIADPIAERFPSENVNKFLSEIVDDVVQFRLEPDDPEEAGPSLEALYGVNIVLCHDDLKTKPVVFERTPSLINLLGTVEPKFGPGGMAISDYRGISAGALLNASCGYLILDANDVVTESGAWRSLMRTLRTGRLEIVPPEAGWMRQYVVIQPEPIEINVRVILIGDAKTYYMLDHADPDFRELFKVLADFDGELTRSDDSARQYGLVVAHLAHEEGMPPFHKTAVAALVEHGARIVSRSGKLTAKFGRIADLAREAAFLAGKEAVMDHHVRLAIGRTKLRANLPSRKFQEMVESETLMVQTTGEQVGQINGLAVMRSGPLTYGFPARITSTIGPGRAGLINIEGRAQMSGAIHTKGFQILGGLLRHLLRTDHPLAFSASIAFEQSYGGIDGDSASGAEIVCLLSALTGIPVKQGMAMTGAIDQLGNFEAIGGVNEKIEGFYDACNHFGLEGDQGVLVPKSNAGDLMLRPDVAKACAEEKFHVYAVDNIYDAIEVMLGVEAGEFKDGEYPEESVLGIARKHALSFWKRTLASPAQLTSVEQAHSDENDGQTQ